MAKDTVNTRVEFEKNIVFGHDMETDVWFGTCELHDGYKLTFHAAPGVKSRAAKKEIKDFLWERASELVLERHTLILPNRKACRD